MSEERTYDQWGRATGGPEAWRSQYHPETGEPISAAMASYRATVSMRADTNAVKRFLDRMRNVGVLLSRDIAKDALKAGGAMILAAIKARAPRRTGLLQSSLKLRAGKGDWPGKCSMLIQAYTSMMNYGLKTRNAGIRARLAHGEHYARYRVFYAPMVEHGHKIGYRALSNGRGRYSTGMVKAQPFAGPGFDSVVDAAGELIETRIGDAIAQST